MSDQRFFYACEEGVVQAFIYRLIHESFQLISFSKEKWPATIPAFCSKSTTTVIANLSGAVAFARGC